MRFPEDFVWGAASAAFQIEGGRDEDGKGPSIWDAFCDRPDAVWQDQTGKIACDHYHRWREDVHLLADLGLKAYRFSIAWPRVLPAGEGRVNWPGLAFYDRLVDELLAAGITPYVTLYHWDMPLALQDRGGWLNAMSPKWFEDYTRVVVKQLSDRVGHWITLNEPQCFIHFGHVTGLNAPGLRLSDRDALRAGHHALLAHGQAVRAIRELAPATSSVGFAPVGVVATPVAESAQDIESARMRTFAADTPTLFNSAWWMDPVFLGHYPEDGLKRHAMEMPEFNSREMDTISTPVDFCAFNLYEAPRVRGGDDGQPESVAFPPGYPATALEWNVTPSALYWASRFFHERYGLPLLITENGMSGRDWVSLDGCVHDPARIDFLSRYLAYVGRACAEELPVQGYFQWSILDNFEWSFGYKERFGLIHVDYTTGRRTPKDSYHWYRQVIEAHGDSLPDWHSCDPLLPHDGSPHGE
jgi:beta-glucosidase